MKDGNQKRNSRLLIVGAFAPEIDELAVAAGQAATERAGTPGSDPQRPDPQRPDRQRSDLERPVFEILEAGIGSVAAATAVQARLLDSTQPPPDEVLFLGSAGVYEARLAAGPECFAFSSRFYKRDLATLEGRAHAPGPLADLLRTDVGPRTQRLVRAFEESRAKAGAALFTGVTNSTDSVSLTQVEVKDCDFENLETYGIAWVCLRHAVPFGAFYALTNHVGPSGSDQWRANHREMSLELQRFVSEFLAGE
ncbi:MAG: hypothetical protein NXI24_09090 [bacterium]|nr:hypothetical protein [bacterium]